MYLRFALLGALLVLATASVGVAVQTKLRYDSPNARLSVVISTLTGIMAFSAAGQLFVTPIGLKIWLFTAWTALLWLLVSLAIGWVIILSGHPHWMGRSGWIVVGGYGVLCSLTALTNPAHELLYAEFALTTEPYLTLEYTRTALYQVYSVGLLLLSLFAFSLLIPALMRSRRWTNKQNLVLLATYIPAVFVGIGIIFYDIPPAHPNSLTIGSFVLILGILFLRNEHLVSTTLGRQTVVSQIEDGMIILDSSENVADFNESASDLFPGLADALGDPLEDAIPTLYDTPGTQSSDRPVVEYATVTRGGEERIVSVDWIPLTVGESRYGYVVTTHDITDQREQQRKLQRQNERLEQFASMVSHDLRNPLQVARGRSQLLEEPGDDHHTAINDALERMEDMIDEMLTLARAGRAIEGSQTESVSLEPLVAEVWEMVRTDGATLETDFGSESTLEADPNLLRHVFENLFRNAIDHNEPPVAVRVGRIDDPGGFYIEDDGAGLPDGDPDTLFEQGYTTNDDGSGLGLSIVQDIVEGHGWTIAAVTHDDSGARFEIYTNERATGAAHRGT